MTMATGWRPESTDTDIGIIGMEYYFPRYFVDQKELGILQGIGIV